MAQQIVQEKYKQYGPYRSQLPLNFSLQLKEGEQFKEVIIRHGFIVDAIGFVISMPCGGTYTTMFGGSCGEESRIVLNCGEYITKISGTYGIYKLQHNQCIIATIKIHTNQCPNGYGPYGQGTGVECATAFSSTCPLDDTIVGFFGMCITFIGIFLK